eukprot:8980461-Pyramimonas_sp.AAC.1
MPRWRRFENAAQATGTWARGARSDAARGRAAARLDAPREDVAKGPRSTICASLCAGVGERDVA